MDPRGAQLSAAVRAADGLVTVLLTGELDQTTAGSLRERLQELLRGTPPRRLVIDMAGITYLDSAGARELAWAYKRMRALDGVLEVTGLGSQARLRIAQLGLQRIVAASGPDGPAGPDGDPSAAS